MQYCQYCGGTVDRGATFCSECGEALVGEDTGWYEFQIQERVNKAKHRANMYAIAAIVLVTLGIMGGGVFCVSASAVGFFGIVLVCLGIGCTAPADRYEHKAKLLKKQLSR